MSSTEEIHRLFSPTKRDHNRFCTDENTVNPLEVINRDHISDKRYIHVYPNEYPILRESFVEVFEEQSNTWFSLIDFLKHLFGYDPHKTKYENWFKALQDHIKRCLIDEPSNEQGQPMPNYNSYSKACEYLELWAETRNAEYLLKLYTLDITISQYFAMTSERTNCLYEPILFNLINMHKRAYQGYSYRGLTMTKTEYTKYQRALDSKTSYIKIKTMCSTSLDRLVANMFAESAKSTNTTVRVIMIFLFTQSCSTALNLTSDSSNIESITNYEVEKEVLIQPETIFSVKDIREDDSKQFIEIVLEHYDTTEYKAEMHQERLQSFIDDVILDS